MVWWDPTKLQLDEEEAMGLRQVKLLQADEGGAASQAGLEAYQRWTGRRKAVRETAGAPLIKVAPPPNWRRASSRSRPHRRAQRSRADAMGRKSNWLRCPAGPGGRMAPGSEPWCMA